MSIDRSVRADLGQPFVDGRERSVHLLLLHIAITCPADAKELSRRLARPAKSIQEDLKNLMRQNLVFVHDGSLHTAAAPKILDESDSDEIRNIQNQVLAEVEAAQTVDTSTLVALTNSRCAHRTLLQALVKRSCESPDDTAVLSALSTVAQARGLTDERLKLLRAQEFALRGRASEVISLVDPLIGSDDTAIARQAAVLSGAVHLQENRAARACALYRHIGQQEIGYDAAWAVLAAVLHGDLEQAEQWLAALPNEGLTNQDAGLVNFAHGVIKSVTANGSEALEFLARSTTALAPVGRAMFLPDSPAAVSALIAINSGEPDVAETLLKRALANDLGGRAGRNRHQLLLGWVRMTQGKLKLAEASLTKVGGEVKLNDRDVLLFSSLKAGIARRQSDFAQMRAAWRAVRDKTFGLQLTLFDLLPIGELLVISARMRDTDRTSGLLEQAQTLLRKLGNPVTWAAPLHWQGVQAAFQAENPAALLPHAAALAEAGKTSRYASCLAQAGNTWLGVLRRSIDFEAVKTSVEALSASGHVWDAARLAGQAALQIPEREEALAMMQLAREVTKDHDLQAASNPRSSALTNREAEVARLVLDGHGYKLIGEQLFISPKTVEHHVARIKNRLGATSRGDLLEKLHDLFARTIE